MPSRSAAPIQMVSPGLASCGQGRAVRRSIFACSASSAAEASQSAAGGSMWSGSPSPAFLRMKACLVASMRPCRWSKLSPAVTFSRSNSARIISEETPCVGGGMLKTVPTESSTDSGSTISAEKRSKSESRSGEPAASRKAPWVLAMLPR